MATKSEANSINELLNRIRMKLDSELMEGRTTKVSILFACNSSGKTRLSKSFDVENKGEVLCFNAFTEDLFSWNNENFVLEIQGNSWEFITMKEFGLIDRTAINFKKFIGLDNDIEEITPHIDISNNRISFTVVSKTEEKSDSEESGIENGPRSIKISRGEENVFVWSVFYTILEHAIIELNEPEELRNTEEFNKIKYVVIDDPVSSMDDTRIITIALELAELMARSKSELKFLITTHHPLFFNVLFNFGKNQRNWDRNNYILSRTGQKYTLKGQGSDSPFAYHHSIISEISRAIQENRLKKYHFNLFRALLEKTANFLGYSGWKKLLSQLTDSETVKKKLDHFSHDKLSDLDEKNLSEGEVAEFKLIFSAFLDEFNWDKSNFSNSA